MKRIAALIVCGLAASCASSPAKIRSSWQPWVGKPIDALVAVWGPPSGTFELPASGGKVYTWVYQGETAITNVPSINMAFAETSSCKVDWTTDAKGILESFRWEGRCKVKKRPDGNFDGKPIPR